MSDTSFKVGDRVHVAPHVDAAVLTRTYGLTAGSMGVVLYGTGMVTQVAHNGVSYSIAVDWGYTSFIMHPRDLLPGTALKVGDKVRVAPFVSHKHLSEASIGAAHHDSILTGVGRVDAVQDGKLDVDVTFGTKRWWLNSRWLVLDHLAAPDVGQPQAAQPEAPAQPVVAGPVFRGGDKVRTAPHITADDLRSAGIMLSFHKAILENIGVVFFHPTDPPPAGWAHVKFNGLTWSLPASYLVHVEAPVQPAAEPIQPKVETVRANAADMAGRCAKGLADPSTRTTLSTLPDYVPPEVAKRRARGYGVGGYQKRIIPTDLDLPGDPY